MSIIRGARIVALATLMVAVAPAFGDEKVLSVGLIEVTVGTGITGLHANEIVYLNHPAHPADTELSHLIWDSVSPTLTSGMTVHLPQGWVLLAKGQLAGSGWGFMSDYDWIHADPAVDDPLPPGDDYAPDNWTDRSQHPTVLDWYFNGSILVGRDVPVSDKVTVNLNGGIKYVTTQWSAHDGTFIYSTDATGGQFRDDVGSSGPGHAITYTQRIPSLVLGADASIDMDKWMLDLGIQGGMSFNVTTTDHHWRRNLLFEDTNFGIAPVAAASASANYALSDMATLFLSASIDATFRARGGETAYDDRTGAVATPFVPNGEGTDLLAGTVAVGVKGHF